MIVILSKTVTVGGHLWNKFRSEARNIGESPQESREIGQFMLPTRKKKSIM